MINTEVYSDDRGLGYGDGLFETLRAVAGSVPLLDYHLERLRDGAGRLGITYPKAEIRQALVTALAASPNGIIKIILTRGRGGRGYSADPANPPTLLVRCFPLRVPAAHCYERGLELGLCDVRLAEQPRMAGIKHLNRLEQVMARRQVDANGWDEGLLLDDLGRPLELTAMNLFARFGDCLWTPSLSGAGVAGVMRQYVINELAPALPMTVQVSLRPLSQLRLADEVFACNSVAGILPVRKLAVWQWPMGEVTRTLQDKVRQLYAESQC
ncbi:MAG: aminodeoxychorismate lyase [Gammaproteobacteria bacterium HGW-Gammaproteobacteria-14]|nr:MAG: aminodeoxychorismate lyase [Gammaproteobacteria bacterium HGW-Gammaproteobacteria-14]